MASDLGFVKTLFLAEGMAENTQWKAEAGPVGQSQLWGKEEASLNHRSASQLTKANNHKTGMNKQVPNKFKGAKLD